MAETMFEKIWKSHVIHEQSSEMALLYVDRHLVHEVTSPKAFENLRKRGQQVKRPQQVLAVTDHCIPTRNRDQPIEDSNARHQVEMLRKNCADFAIPHFDIHDPQQGIVHIVATEQGMIHPGMVVVCGDSHTSTHGAMGALAFGIGTSEIEYTLVSQSLLQSKPRTLNVHFEGKRPDYVTAKDMALTVIRQLGTAGGTGFVIEYTGEAVQQLTMEERCTLCNLSIESGARTGMIAPDEVTFDYLKGKSYSPNEAYWQQAVKYWKSLQSDEGAQFDRKVTIPVAEIVPQVTWGTSPEQVVGIDSMVPSPNDFTNSSMKESCQRALAYMDLNPGTLISKIPIDVVFIGSCTNGRIEDFRAAARYVAGKQVHDSVWALAVPGSHEVKRQAEKEGLDQIFKEAGFEWREPGCSMCLAINDDVLAPGQRCASTSNRNFEGRQGKGSRTHLVSPAMAAAAAIQGHFVDVRGL